MTDGRIFGISYFLGGDKLQPFRMRDILALLDLTTALAGPRYRYGDTFLNFSPKRGRSPAAIDLTQFRPEDLFIIPLRPPSRRCR